MSQMMIRLEPIDKSVLWPHIFVAFQHDNELLERIHIAAPGSAMELASHTCNCVIEQLTMGNCPEYYAVMFNKKPIGFTVIGRKPCNRMYSFGININYRKKEILLTWLNLVKALFHNESFGVPLYNKNERAISFFRRNKFEYEQTGKNFIILWQSFSPQQLD